MATKSQTVYENPWMKVVEERVIRPDGKRGIFGVTHILPGVSILPIDDKKNVFLTKEYHYAVGRETIEAVSGAIETKEGKLEAAKRELREETGLLAKKWIYLGRVDPLTSMVFSPAYLFLARDLRQVKKNLEATEVIKVMKIPFKKAVSWAMNGKITHAETVVLILKVKNILKE